MNASLITDVQNDFFLGEALAVPYGDTIIPLQKLTPRSQMGSIKFCSLDILTFCSLAPCA